MRSLKQKMEEKCEKRTARKLEKKKRLEDGSSSEKSSDKRRTIKSKWTPQSHGEEETLAYIETGSSYDLARLLDERDRVGKKARRCSRPKCEKETRVVLREPAIHSVMQLHQVCRQAEVVARYGLTGKIAYNFSKPTGWNRLNLSRLPSLQLRPPRKASKKRRGLLCPPTVEFNLDMSGFSFEFEHSLPPNNEYYYDWSDSPYFSRDMGTGLGIDVWVPCPPRTPSLYTIEEKDEAEAEAEAEAEEEVEEREEVNQAQAVTMTKIPIWQVRKVPARSEHP
ncbi:hypothetical protein F5Y11DRAFT_234645 [Daldinia sp. FL1419]|nr:hypothetical protein F5Y11DRAFT_234645 [Daldinia sp. FL1419]